MITRRKVLTAVTAGAILAFAWIGFTFAQTNSPVVIGWLSLNSPAAGERFARAFKEAFAALGWKEGVHYVFVDRWADGRYDRLPVLAAEIAATKPALIIAVATRPVAAAAKAAPDTPIVHTSGSDPVAAGFAKSLARPGGMITGLTNINADVQVKFVELLQEVAPKLKRIGFLVDSGVSRPRLMESVQRSIAQYGIEPHFAEAAKVEEIEPALMKLAKHRVQALVVLSSALFSHDRQSIVKLALAQRWPIIGDAYYADDGALISYAADPVGNYRRVAYYVDRILKGTKPGDLPIEQPTKFELVVNLKTAKALGLTIPPAVLVRATKVIE